MVVWNSIQISNKQRYLVTGSEMTKGSFTRWCILNWTLIILYLKLIVILSYLSVHMLYIIVSIFLGSFKSFYSNTHTLEEATDNIGCWCIIVILQFYCASLINHN